MKKCIPLLCLLLMLLLAACGGKEGKPDTTEETHPHTFTEQGIDAEHHFLVCECGEKSQVKKHDFNEDYFCETCGFYIYDMGDGAFSVYLPDEYGSIIRQMDYDDEGKLFYDWTAEYEYYDDLNPKRVKHYVDDVLVSEQLFQQYDSDLYDGVFLSEEISYYEDGGREILTFNEDGNILSVTLIDSADFIVTQDVYIYEYATTGHVSKQTIITNSSISLEVFFQPDSEGCYYPYHYIYYTESGEIESEFYYDEFGNEVE